MHTFKDAIWSAWYRGVHIFKDAIWPAWYRGVHMMCGQRSCGCRVCLANPRSRTWLQQLRKVDADPTQKS
eukprot:1158266-Pelagomonas_calceolata.AAC.4